MALFIRDDTVDALASELQKATNAPTKKDAVKQALENELKRVSEKKPMRERLAASQALAAKMGPRDPNFDMKAFFDEMWGDI